MWMLRITSQIISRRRSCTAAKININKPPTKHVNQIHMWNYSHGVNLSSSCGTGLQAFCEGDASLDAQASREQPAPLQECVPVIKKKIRRTRTENYVYSNYHVSLTSSLSYDQFQIQVWPAPASDLWDVWSSLYLLGDCWCSPYQRRPGIERMS